MPLGDWLNSVILNSAAQEGVEPELADEYGEDHEALAAVHQRLDDLARKIDRLGTSVPAGPAAYAPPHTRNNPDQFGAAHYAPANRGGIDRAVAEISARQRMLNNAPPPPAMRPPEFAAPMPGVVQPAPRAPAQDLSGLEDQLRNITAQIETLRRPGVEDAINALRGELGEIGRSLTDAMPRQSIETIEQQIQGLSRRISEGRQAGVDGAALSGIEHGLAEVRDTLRTLTPAEGLAGFVDAVSGLTHKIDLIVAKNDPATLQQLDAAIVTLREMAAHVASNETVSQLAGYVQTLAQRVEQMAHAGAANDAIGNLEQRVAALSDALTERTQHGGTVPPRLEALVTSLSDKIEQIQHSRGDNIAAGHLEDRIVKLVERLDASDSRLVHLEAIERGLADLLMHIDKGNGLRADHAAPGPIDAVERLAAVAHDIRGDAPLTQPVGKLAVRAVVDAPPVAPPVQPPQPPQPAPQAEAPKRPMMPGVKRPAIDPNLPPDQPIEPGSMPPRATADLAARIAASEAALGPANPAAGNQPGEKLGFIAAARRAAQAAAQEGPAGEVPAQADQESRPSFGAKFARRVKKLFVAASMIAITIGSLEIASNYYGFGLSHDADVKSAQLSNSGKANVDDIATTGSIGSESKPAAAPSLVPALNSQAVNVITTPSFTNPPPATTPPVANGAAVANALPQAMLSARPIVPAIPMPPAVSAAPGASGDKLPAALGPSALRTAAMNGNPAAAYEIGVRYAEGRGVTTNLDEAARWFERAASKGLAPAQFRLASLLEKGQGVKKDLTRARKLYLSAAAKGNAKAMHNLAVLYAEGADGKPDYAAAAQWFEKAANRGVADSQYNLAILYARGLGVERSFADSYKWFALAAIQGDRESGKKRDDIASRLDAKTLAAAQHAVKIWKAEPQPEEAIAVPHPPGGWDHANPPAPARSRPRSPGAYEIGKR